MYEKLKQKLLNYVYDQNLIEYYYLHLSVEEVLDKFNNLRFKILGDKESIPFNAKVKGYIGAVDNENDKWIIKEINKNDLFYYKLCELAYLLDFEFLTLAAPTLVLEINDKFYRGSKIVQNAVQIGSYNYLEKQFKKIIACDLINRWLYFDEDRNPNNYMVIHNSRNTPLILVIDYDKVDLETTTMKIKGDDEKFGWVRKEKTRFLTLLKPSNFENFYLEDFSERLTLMTNLDTEKLRNICLNLFRGIIRDPVRKTDLIINNFKFRREYINTYFRKWFNWCDTDSVEKEKKKYSGLGKSFVKIFDKE